MFKIYISPIRSRRESDWKMLYWETNLRIQQKKNTIFDLPVSAWVWSKNDVWKKLRMTVCMLGMITVHMIILATGSAPYGSTYIEIERHTKTWDLNFRTKKQTFFFADCLFNLEHISRMKFSDHGPGNEQKRAKSEKKGNFQTRVAKWTRVRYSS